MNQPLTFAEERQLVEAADTGDHHARNKVIMNLYPTVRWMVSKQMRYSQADREDAVQFIISVLCEKYVKFDSKRNVRFSTYAIYWIRDSLHVFKMKRRLIRVPEHIYKKRKKEVISDLPQQTNDWLKVFPLEYDNENTKLTFRESLTSREAKPDSYLEQAEEYAGLIERLENLSPREKEVFHRRLLGEKLLTIGDSLGVTRERIRQIEAVVIEKLRTPND
ncbi:MAG: sigma-70 family RNA polymerase sigma factor [Gemmatales bacterium]